MGEVTDHGTNDSNSVREHVLEQKGISSQRAEKVEGRKG
jgi:hypothetical protein